MCRPFQAPSQFHSSLLKSVRVVLCERFRLGILTLCFCHVTLPIRQGLTRPGVWWPVMKPGTRGVPFLLSCRVWVWNIQGGSALGKCRSEEKDGRKQKPWVSKAMRQRESEWCGVSSNSWKNKQVERNRQRSWVMCMATSQEFRWGHQRVAYTTRPELLLSCCWVARTKI